MQKKYPLKLYNTLTREKEVFHPKGEIVTLYTCGPTIYDFAHIGNFRTYIFEDLLKRTLQLFGMKVKQVMNITDVDDKTIRGAIQKGELLKEYTEPFKKAFFEDMKTLHIEKADLYPEATSYIDKMILLIAALIEKGYAYKGSDGSVYFSIKKFPSYGKLSHIKWDEEVNEASKKDSSIEKRVKDSGYHRISSDEYDKENVADFVLWKHYDPKRDADIYWDSPFGKGRPGWHIECSAMALYLLGKTIDIHCGGVDNIFPHHENEIAQSEAFTGQPFVRFWVHAYHLIVENKKMSKSLGNFFTLRSLLKKGVKGNQIRYLLLSTHYRTELNFTLQGLDAAKSSLSRLSDFILRMKEIIDEDPSTDMNPKVESILEKTWDTFCSSLADDLNISSSLASLFDLVREINFLVDKKRIGKKEAEKVVSLLKKMDQIFDFLPFKDKENKNIPPEILEAAEKRIEARKKKDFSLADQLRDFIHSKGFEIEDKPDGYRIKKR